MQAVDRRAMLGAVAACVAAPAVLRAQVRPIRIVVPFPPGGAADYVARLIASELGEAGTTRAIVENKPGANGVIGIDAVAKAAPDGQTICFTTLGALVINPHLQQLPFAPLVDLTPVTLAVVNTLTLVVRQDLAARTVGDLLALARENPRKLSAASSGAGSILHIALELLKLRGGVEITHIPYKGEGPAVGDLVNGQVDCGIMSMISVQAHLASGALRILGVTGARRASAMPDVPTIAEQGLAGYEAAAWNGVFVPARTPAEVVARLNEDVTRVLRKPSVVEALRQRGSEAIGSTADELARVLKADHEKYGDIVRTAGIRLE